MSRGRIAGQKVGPYIHAGSIFSSDLRRLRVEAGLTQSELARMACISERTVRTLDRWGDTGTAQARQAMAQIGRRITPRLFDDDEARALCVKLADGWIDIQTGKPKTCKRCGTSHPCVRCPAL